MEKLDHIVPLIKRKLVKRPVPAKVLLDRFRVVEESSRLSGAYTDPVYFPAYYYLGCLVSPANMVEVGFQLGFASGCFFMGCKTVEHFLGFQQHTDEWYTPRLAKKNIRLVYRKNFEYYHGQVNDAKFLDLLAAHKWDIILVNEDAQYDYIRLLLDRLWLNLNEDGIMVVDRTENKAFGDFCQIKNRTPHFFKTRYRLGMMQK